MLLCKNIRHMFAKMYFFKGKASFNPNSLNNLASTYFLAHHWQAINAGKGSSMLPPSTSDKECWDNIPDNQRKTYTYENWEQLIKDAHQFDSDVQKIFEAEKDPFSSRLFNYWSVYGDGMALTEYQATAVFNGSQIKQLSDQEKFPITSKIGSHKSVIADQDTDAQMYSKWFGLQLKLSEQDIVKFGPTSFRNITERVKGMKGSTRFKADWFFTGKLEKKYVPQDKQTRSRFAQWVGKNLYFRKVQYRFDLTTKLSNIVGYFTESEGENYHVPNFQNWRKINLISSQIKTQYLFLKEVENGYLIDLSNAILDKNDQNHESEYPQSFKVEIFPQESPNDKLIINLTQSEIQKVFLSQSGMMYIPKETSPFKKLPQKALEVSMKMIFDDETINLSGVQSKYFLCIRDPVVKSNLQQNMIKAQQQYLNETELQLCCTSYGKKIPNMDLNVQIKDNNSGAMTNFKGPNGKKNLYTSSAFFNQKIQNIFNNPQTPLRKSFVKKYGSLEQIKKNVFQNKFSDITSVSETLKQRVDQGNWKSLQSNNVFQLKFDKPNENFTKKSVRFQNGTARVKVQLNEKLTSKNNPRHQICRSLSMMGSFIVSETQGKLKSQQIRFNAIFFQTDLHLRTKTDWVTHIGPFLRTMGLMYPSMQKIVDLYNFQSLVMPAMKRAFDIEDEDHPRYMPSTREISPLQHRQVRKWLYEPLFNSDLCIHPKKSPDNSKEKIINLFNEKKKVLISTLKKAFTLELSTIPLYLSAMFSTNEKNIKNVLRSVSIDEMKHLFIVSNVLNAIHDKQSGPAVPYKDPEHIPCYPTPLVEVLKVVNDPLLKQFLEFDIQPYTAHQLLKFICIELPAQLNYLELPGCLELEKKVSDPLKRGRILCLKSLLNRIKKQSCENPGFKTIGEVYGEIIDAFWELNDMEEFYRKKYCQDGQSEIKLFSGDPRQQFTYFGLENMAEIYDLRSALNQFRLIVSEGEGANLFVCDAQIHKESHFIKFIEIYTGCQVELNVTNPHTDKAKVIFDFVEDQSLIVTDIDKKVWNSEADQSFDAEINKLICSDKIGGDGNYADAYAKPAFLNAYQKLLEELDYIFNSNIDQFKEFYAQELVNLSDLDLKRKFEVARRAKMENAIAKMRQMTLHSDKVITPIGVPNSEKIGSRPSYNVNFSEKKSIKCPSKSQEKIK